MGVNAAEFAGLLDLLYEGLLRPEAWGDFLSWLGPPLVFKIQTARSTTTPGGRIPRNRR
jgi:hypothetical protein